MLKHLKIQLFVIPGINYTTTFCIHIIIIVIMIYFYRISTYTGIILSI